LWFDEIRLSAPFNGQPHTVKFKGRRRYYLCRYYRKPSPTGRCPSSRDSQRGD